MTRHAVAVALLAAATVSACGAGDSASRHAAKGPPLASAAALEQHPYAISCGHVTDQEHWAEQTRLATVTIADDVRMRGLNRLQKTQSLFYAMTELCKGRPPSYQPAATAIKAVRSGRYRADLNQP
jgi:hypothetical protein